MGREFSRQVGRECMCGEEGSEVRLERSVGPEQ